jgi:hypothetical protein
MDWRFRYFRSVLGAQQIHSRPLTQHVFLKGVDEVPAARRSEY